MGQRSQMIVGFTNSESLRNNEGPTCNRRAMYFQWRWGVHLVVCAAQAVRLARKQVEDQFLYMKPEDVMAAQCATYAVNQVSGQIQGWQNIEEETEWLNESGSGVFDNNNGMFLIQLHASAPGEGGNRDNSFTFGFTIGSSEGGDNATVVTADEYLEQFGETVRAWRELDEGREALDAALETLREAEADGFLMSQEEADKLCGTRAEFEEGFSRAAA